MIKKIICLLCLFIPIASSDFTEIQPNLSGYQKFQLDYFALELEQLANIARKEWTVDLGVRILVERMELSITQSSKSTQESMKQQIKNLFAEYDMDITFVENNLIMLLTPMQKPDFFQQNDESNMPHPQKQMTTHSPHRHTDSIAPNHQTIPKLQRIHGARRTANRIKTEQARQHAQKQQEEFVKQQQKQASINRKSAFNRTIDYYRQTAQEQIYHNTFNPKSAKDLMPIEG